jgi:hypothetical protein
MSVFTLALPLDKILDTALVPESNLFSTFSRIYFVLQRSFFVRSTMKERTQKTAIQAMVEANPLNTTG